MTWLITASLNSRLRCRDPGCILDTCLKRGLRLAGDGYLLKKGSTKCIDWQCCRFPASPKGWARSISDDGDRVPAISSILSIAPPKEFAKAQEAAYIYALPKLR